MRRKHREINTLWWGPFPWEQDGGAVVQYYQLRKLEHLRPRWDYYGVPKVPEELNTTVLPWMKFLIPQKVEEEIPYLMQDRQIPLMTTFHIAEHVEKLIDPVHLIGGKILQWQTVHWETDMVFNCKRLNELDGFIAPTNYAKQLLINKGGVDYRKIAIIPHGVDTNLYYPHQTSIRKNLGIREDQKIILYTGRLSLWKGIHNIIPIMRELIRKYNCVFAIRGGFFSGNLEGKKIDYILSTIASRNPNVLYLPQWESPDFMEELFASSDIVLFPSGHEGFGCPIVEGMSSAKPVITTDLANIREILGTKSGMLLTPKDEVGICDEVTPIKVPSTESIRDALVYLLENPEDAQIMGENGRYRAMKYFDLTKVCRKWIKVIEDIIPEDYDMDEVSKERLLTT